MRRVALTLRADAVEDVLDVLMPLLPQGVYEQELEGGRAEVAFYVEGVPTGVELEALVGGALLGQPGGRPPLSCHELVEDAARATILLVPGLLRLGVRPLEDAQAVLREVSA
jgi:hypothetical protein